MEIDLLCSGSKGNSCLVRSEHASILIDCGPTTKRYLMSALDETGQDPHTLDALFITHSHSDHIRQLRHLADLPVYACCSLRVKNPKGEEVPLDLHPVKFYQKIQIQDLEITPLPLSHDAGPTMGFVIECGREKLVYITDTGYINASLMPWLKDADYYVFESNHDVHQLMSTNRPLWLKQRILSDEGHLCNEEAALILSRCITSRTRKVVLAHLSEEANTPGLALDAMHQRLQAEGLSFPQLKIEAACQFEILHVSD